jgi:hypothetical protein
MALGGRIGTETAMRSTSTETSPPGLRRGHVGLLVLLCLFLTSGAGHLPGPTVAEHGEAPRVRAATSLAPVSAPGPGPHATRLAAVLEEINPVLSPRERLRIGAAIELYSAF